jgi:hypothetical protein
MQTEANIANLYKQLKTIANCCITLQNDKRCRKGLQTVARSCNPSQVVCKPLQTFAFCFESFSTVANSGDFSKPSPTTQQLTTLCVTFWWAGLTFLSPNFSNPWLTFSIMLYAFSVDPFSNQNPNPNILLYQY